MVVSCEVSGPAPTSITVAAFGTTRAMTGEGSRFHLLVPVPVRAASGQQKIKVTGTWPDRRIEALECSFSVTKRDFAVSRITATKEQTDNVTDEKLRQDSVKVSAAKSRSSPTKTWASGFQLPLQARVTTAFGMTRYVNGVETWRHSGIDYGAAPGAKVMAAGDGAIVLATKLNGTGNTVIIDHGFWLFSSYGHMETIQVKPGEKVKKGQVVVTGGSTGFSTGPHLHWTVTVGSIAVDPTSLIRLAKDLSF